MKMGNYLKPWYESVESLEEALMPDHCVIARPDNSFGIVVFSEMLPLALAKAEIKKMEEEYGFLMNFQLYNSSRCSNCHQGKIIPLSNVCPECQKLFDRSQRASAFAA